MEKNWIAPIFFASVLIHGQTLDTNCVVNILNRSAYVKSDGSFDLFNIPAGVASARVRATCKDSSGTHYGESDFYNILPNQGTGIGPVRFKTTSTVPTDIQLTASGSTLTSAGATTQLTILAALPGGATKNVTSSDSGTTYLSTNRSVATVDENGLVTAIASGRVLVTASHEGILKTLFITVSLGSDTDGDGMPNDFEIAQGLNPNDPFDALVDLDLDGLTNFEEFQAGTALRNADTDGDGIRDGEEVSAGQDGFVTNPLAADTDGDGIRDALEIQTGSNPADAQSRNLAQALQSLEVSPARISFIYNVLAPVESARQLAVTGHLIDGSALDLTPIPAGTLFETSDPSVAGFGLVSGLVLSGGPGTATITVSNSGFSAQLPVDVVDITPSRIAYLPLPGSANGVDASGALAYVASGSAGLHIVDVSIPTQPILVGTFNTPGSARDVWVEGGFAFIADSAAGLQILDVSNPALPVPMGAQALPGAALEVVVREGLAYVADSSGLRILNVSVPSAPVLIGGVDLLEGIARGLDVSGNLAIVAAGSGGVMTFDVSNPAAPHLLGQVASLVSPEVDCRHVKIMQGFATVANGVKYTPDILVVDISNPAQPVMASGNSRFFGTSDVAVDGSIAVFSTDTRGRIFIYRIQEDGQATFVNQLVMDDPNDVYINGTGLKAHSGLIFQTATKKAVDMEPPASGLYISRYLLQEDLGGISPVVAITAPAEGASVIGGDTIQVEVEAHDDVFVRSVELFADSVRLLPLGPAAGNIHRFQVPVPSGATTLVLRAAAEDMPGNRSLSQTVSLTVVPPPMTTAIGRIVDAGGAPVGGAMVWVAGDSALSGTDGRFEVAGIRVRQPRLAIRARIMVSGRRFSGLSDSLAAVVAGSTDFGDIVVRRGGGVTPDAGEKLPLIYSSSARIDFPAGFSFPFYGTSYDSVFVNAGGNLTFGAGDENYNMSVDDFRTGLPRIAPQWRAWTPIPSEEGGIFYKQFQGYAQFTWKGVRVPNWEARGTFQVLLYADGAMDFSFEKLPLSEGAITGITPGTDNLEAARDITAEAPFTTAPGLGFYEVFYEEPGHGPDLGYSAMTIDPSGSGGYDVSYLPIVAPLPTIRIDEPAEGRTEVAGSEVYFSVEPSEEVGVQSVEFFINDVPVGTVESPMWRVIAPVPETGPITLRARMTDKRGRTATTADRVVTIVADQPPVLTTVGPNPEAALYSGTSVTYGVFVSDDVRPVQVAFFVNDEEISTQEISGQGSYFAYFDVPESDSVRLRATATDSRGLVGNSEVLVLDVIPNLPPTISITAPGNGDSRIAEERIQIRAQAGDDHGVSYVYFYQNGEYLGYDDTAPYTLFHTLPWGPGSVELTALALDIHGRTTASSIQVDVLASPLTTVIGQVVDSAGVPVVGADVAIAPNHAVTTDSGGRFSIPEVRANRAFISVRISKDDTLIGYAPPRHPVQDGETDFGIVKLRRLDSLEASWPFSGNPFDTTGHGHHGELFGGALSPDRFGKADSAVRFTQDSAEYIHAGEVAISAAAITYTAWIKVDSYPAEYPHISHIMGVDGPGGTGALRLGDANLDSNLLNFKISYGRVTGSTPLETGTWYFVAATLDQQGATLYLNGAQEANGPNVSYEEFTGSFVIGHGLMGGAGERGFRGSIDDARVYKRSLSQAEIQALYHQGGWPP